MLASFQEAQAQQEFAHLLNTVFRAQQCRAIRCVGIDQEGNKVVRPLGRPLAGSDVRKHLSSVCSVGVGALGITPGFHTTKNGRRRWFTRFIALDFDSSEPEQLLPLLGEMLDSDIRTVVTTGTSGRGSHVYVFFSQPTPVHEAFRIAECLKKGSARHKLPYPELRPSRPFARSMAILLPFRGATRDDLGFNPWLDPESLQPIRLSAAARQF
jgi:hypothetical protein